MHTPGARLLYEFLRAPTAAWKLQNGRSRRRRALLCACFRDRRFGGFAAAAAAYEAVWGAGLYMKTSGSATGGVVHTLALVSSDAYPHRTARATLPQPSCSRTTSCACRPPAAAATHPPSLTPRVPRAL